MSFINSQNYATRASFGYGLALFYSETLLPAPPPLPEVEPLFREKHGRKSGFRCSVGKEKREYLCRWTPSSKTIEASNAKYKEKEAFQAFPGLSLASYRSAGNASRLVFS